MIRDVLDHLEWYVGLDAKMGALVDFLDRGAVYEQAVGSYTDGILRYRIEEYTTDETGEETTAEGSELQILLEGEELFSLRRGEEVALVTTNTVSMFLYLKGGEVYRHKQSTDGSRYVKKVIFFL
ncbi:MAG TPA: hypothetical protein PLH14_06975 [Sphaerochaeta sp.]|nr:hypothetical protein [Sphaerochaeta sp.]